MEEIKVFLSYASEDEAAVERLYDRLKNDGFRPWMAKRDILPGEQWEVAIWRAVREADFVLICLSPEATVKRGFLQKEIRQSLENWKEKLEDDIYLIPVKLLECSVPTQLSQFHWVDLQANDGYSKLVAAITEGSQRRSSSPVPLPNGMSVVSAIIQDKQEHRYDCKIEYPQIEPEADESLRTVNKRLTDFARDCIQRFRTERVDHGYDAHQTKLFPTFETKFSASFVGHEMFVVIFTMWSFHPVAAHPNSETRTLTFLLSPYVELRFMDLFTPDSQYLKIISEYCIRDLHEQRGIKPPSDDWIIRGAGPQHDNFEAFVLTRDRLKLIFDPYR